MAQPLYHAAVPRHLQESFCWLVDEDELEAATALARTLVDRLPRSSPETFDYAGYLFYKCKAYPAAAEAAFEALRLLPESPEAAFNAARCAARIGDHALAERLARRAIELRPDWIDAKIEWASFVCAQGRVDESYEELSSLARGLPPTDPNHDVVEFNLGWHDIRRGQFRRGLRGLQIGRKLGIWGRGHQYPKPQLPTGRQSLAGKTVLVAGEGGAGDEIINVRFAAVLAERGARVIWVTAHPGLSPLLSRTPGILAVYPRGASAVPSCDYWVPCMDLPLILALELNEVSSRPFLRPDAAFEAKWSKIIPPSPRLKVGLRWQGNARYEQDLMRSVPFALLEGLAELEGVELYSLQRDAGAGDLKPGSPVRPLAEQLVTWEDTAAAMSQLDLIVSSCTSVPHLAASLGRPTWLLCPINSYYLWATPGETSPWYDTVRLFRQTRPGHWDDAVGAVARSLTAQLAQRRSHAR